MLSKWLLTIIFFFLVSLSSSKLLAEPQRCYPKLWDVNNEVWSQISSKNDKMISKLKKSARKYLAQEPNPIMVLGSAGKTSINDPSLKKSRKGFQDADHAAVLSLLYILTSNPIYFNKARDILLAWATINKPTGNPIDESRLEGMVWAYDLLTCQLAENDKIQIEHWLETIRQKKLTWHYGASSGINNHRIHQLKMLLLLDKVLNHAGQWERDLASAKKYSLINVDSKTGESVDYRQRHALHYHNYTLKAWLEISLITGCCQKPVTQAFNFLIERIRSNQIDGEFLNSEAKIDGERADGGFDYAKQGGTFDIREAIMPIVTYYTLETGKPDDDLWTLVHGSKPSPWLSFLLARRMIWQSGNTS